MSALAVLKQRTSVNHFDPAKTLGDEEIRELIAHAVEAPSAFNIQHWRFVAVREKTSKEKLRDLAYGQQKVADASVNFIILGDLSGHEKLPQAWSPLLKAGVVDQKGLEGIVGMANGAYAGNAQAARDEAIRSASLAAMNLMTAAQAKGLVSAPMVGFDPIAVKREFAIPDHYLPVLIVAVGHAAPGNWPKKPRFAVDQVLSFEKGRDWQE